MQLRLEVSEGPHQGRKITLRSPASATFGRTNRSDFVFGDDPQLSSLHFRISCDDAGCEIEDLRSTNGTMVNQQRVSLATIRHGDRIRAGMTVFEVELDAGELPPSESELPKRSRDTARTTATETSTDPGLPQVFDVLPSLNPTPSPAPPHSPPPPPPPLPPPPREWEPSVPRDDRAEARPTVVLRIKNASGVERTVWIRAGQHLTFGRDEQSDVVLEGDPLLSSLHFAIKFDGKQCELRDLDSRNGVSVNGDAVQVTNLHHGDSVVAGGTTLTVSLSGVARAEEPRPEREAAGSREYASAVPRQKWPPFASALLDADLSVRRRVLVSAAWRREPWLPEHGLRRLQESTPDWQAGYVAAVLAAPDLAEKIIAVLAKREDPRCFDLLGALGSPLGMPMVLAGLEHADPRVAIAAGNAFRRITGRDVAGQERATVTPTRESGQADHASGTAEEIDEDWPVIGDEFEAEFAEEVALPDVVAARNYWQQHADRFARGVRWCGGIDVGRQTDAADLLDLQSRAEMLLREHYHRRITVAPRERYLIRL